MIFVNPAYRYEFQLKPDRGKTLVSANGYGYAAMAMRIGETLAGRILAGNIKAPRADVAELSKACPSEIEIVVIDRATREKDQSRTVRR